jgi:ABC-2 type transport system ATP-binding protein
VKADAVMERMGFAALADRPAGALTLPDRKRLEVARALATEPRLLLLDEVMAGLRPTEVDGMVGVLREINREHGTTVFLTTQYLEEADQLADRVAIIDGGRIVADGSPGELKAKIGFPLLSVVAADGSTPDDVSRVLATFGEVVPGAVERGAAVRLPGGSKAMADAVRALDEAGVRFAEVDLTEPSLDDVFLASTGRHLGADDDVSE